MTPRMVSAVVAGAMVACGACSRREETPAPAPTPAPAVATAPPAIPPPAPPRKSPPSPPEKPPELTVPLRPLDKQLLAATKGGFDAKRVRAALKGGRSTASLVSRPDKESGTIEVDLDGDRLTDERWRFEKGGAVTRVARVRGATREDEFKLEGEAWRLVAGSGRSATQEILPPVAMRPIDKEILARAGKPGEVADDATPGKPYRIALSKELGSSKLNRARVDLDRDGQWDERWWIEPAGVRRDVAPRDNGDYTTRYRLVDGKWFAQ